jgi:hypothetical protein
MSEGRRVDRDEHPDTYSGSGDGSAGQRHVAVTPALWTRRNCYPTPQRQALLRDAASGTFGLVRATESGGGAEPKASAATDLLTAWCRGCQRCGGERLRPTQRSLMPMRVLEFVGGSKPSSLLSASY